jgi:hypothetical protein
MASKTADEIIQDIAAVLAKSSGEKIEDIARQVLTNDPYYVGDSMFSVKE